MPAGWELAIEHEESDKKNKNGNSARLKSNLNAHKIGDIKQQ
jgi:hypothetical protein